MKKLLSTLLVLMGCKGMIEEKLEDKCFRTSSLYLPEKIYEEPLSNMSCREYERRSSFYNSDCYIASSNSSNNDYELNTEVDGVAEARKFSFSEELIFQVNEQSVFVRSKNRPTDIVNQLELRYLEDLKVLNNEKYLIVIGHEELAKTKIQLYRIEGEQVSYLRDFDFPYAKEIKLREKTLIVESYQENLSEDFTCEDIYYVSDAFGKTLTVTRKIHLDEINFAIDTNVLFGKFESHIDTKHEYYVKKDYSSARQSIFTKFDSGELKINHWNGFMIPRFGIKEYGDHVLVFSSDLNLYSDLRVMDNDLNIVAKLTNIAPGEIIYATRYFENRAYLVTYKNIDPFFSFDLTDPTRPVLEGELKIPGVSHYLHPLFNDYIIGFGETEPGSLESLVKIVLYDVKDGAGPKEVDSLILQDKRILELFYNHHKISTYKNYFLIQDKNELYVFLRDDDSLVFVQKVPILNETQFFVAKEILYLLNETEVQEINLL